MYKRYEKMKDSGVNGIGKIPEFWKIDKLKFHSTIQFSSVDKHTKDDEIHVRLCNYVNVYYNDIITDEIDFMVATATADEIKKFIIREGDVLITKDSESWDDIAIPAYVSIKSQDIICGYHLAHIRTSATTLNGKYLSYAFKANGIVDQFKVAANGVTRYGIGKQAISDSSFVFPPLPEQKAIAAFLDRETSRIDKLIEKKERHIELLKEKRQALITRAVTRGLDPSVKMKDSGVEWFKQIPTHWLKMRLKNTILQKPGAVKTGPFGSQLKSNEMESGEIKVYNQRNVLDNDFTSGENYIDYNKYCELKSFTIEIGDILLTSRGTIGAAVIFPEIAEKGILHPCLIRIQVNDRIIHRKYLTMLIQDCLFVKEEFNYFSNATTIEVIYSETLKELLIPLPPIDEQNNIVLFIERETSRIDEIIEKVNLQITKLRELRQTLISDAVTGKIDVRDYVSSEETAGMASRKVEVNA